MFFFISWGSKVVRLVFGGPETHHCEICKEQRSFRKIVTYKVNHVWYLFRWVSQKSYGVICEICRNGHVIDTRAAEAAAGKSPIPFMDRMGWVAGLGAIGVLGATVAVAGAVDTSRDQASLASPAVGDLYEVDLAKFEKTPEASVMYSSLLVSKVTPDSIEVHMPKSYSTGLSGVQDAVSDGRARKLDFYTDEVMAIPRSGLAKLKADGAIIRVEH